jgi:GMP synthase-like glutamine amidotransferase
VTRGDKPVKLALLNALPRQYILESDVPDTEKFKRLFQAVDVHIEYLVYDATEGELPASPAVADAFLVTGSPCSVYDTDPWIADLAEFVRQCAAQQKKLVGVCFGHQLIAQALGGQVEKSRDGWLLGLHKFHLYRQPAWLSPAKSACSLYFINQDQVVTLPPGAVVIGGGDVCPYAIYGIANRVLGLQAHFEHTQAFMQAIIDYLAPRLTAEECDEAARSLARGVPDDELVVRWVVNFLKNEVTA